jgi:hypothetical protein
MDVGFERADDIVVKHEKKGSSGLYPLFTYSNNDAEDYFIIGNKGNNGHFATDFKQVDFFMMIRNKSRYTLIDELITKLKKIKHITSVIEIEPKEMKSAENFLFI